MSKSRIHEPVLISEVVKYLHLDNKAHLKAPTKYLDATTGAGGHASEIVRRGGFVLGIEADPQMLKVAKKTLEKACPATIGKDERGECFKLIHGNFREIASIAKRAKINKFAGILFDLGISSVHLDDDSRGFSFQQVGAPLDMRLDATLQAVTAADLLNKLRGEQLLEMFMEVLEWNEATELTKLILKVRTEANFVTVGDFLKVCDVVLKKRGNTHKATKAFMALRMGVNSELQNLNKALPAAINLLDKKGRLLVISFHSGEDAIVKKYFRELESKKIGNIITPKAVKPQESEIDANPRARSAKLRVFEKNAKKQNK